MCKKMSAAISKDTKAQAKTFSKTVDSVFQDIVWQFENMVDQDSDDKGEDDLKDKFKLFLEKAEPDFEDIKMDLKRIKRKYGMWDGVMQENEAE